MMSLTKLLKHNTKDCNEMVYHLFGQIICRASSVKSYFMDKDITMPVDIYETRQHCTGPGGFSIHDKVPCPKAPDIGGHTAMTIGDGIGKYKSWPRKGQ
jgi:hypothetical protein